MDHLLYSGNAHVENTPVDVIRGMLGAAAGDNWPAGLVVHVGGGMLGRLRPARRCQRLRAMYESVGAFPVFLDWATSPIDVVTSHISGIAGERLFRAIVKMLVKFLRAKVLAPGVTRQAGFLPIDDGGVELELARLGRNEEPFGHLPAVCDADATLLSAEERQLVAALADDPEMSRAVSELLASMTRWPSREPADGRNRERAFLAGDIVAAIRQNVRDGELVAGVLPLRLANGAVLALLRAITRLSSGRGHGLYPTVVEETLREFYAGPVLRRFWDQTKRDAMDACDPDQPGNAGAGLIEAIGALQRRGWHPRITLVGHSAGCMLLSFWIERAIVSLPEGPTFDMIWIEPACPAARMAEMVSRAGGRIGGFRQFALCDELERRDPVIPRVYTRSLRYLISGLLEYQPDTLQSGLERSYEARTGWRPDERAAVAAIDQFCAVRPDARVWSMAGGEAAALEAVRHILQHGFEPATSH
jgi:hypothetical protein